MNEVTDKISIIYKTIVVVIGIVIGSICGINCYKELCDNDDNML